MFQFESTCGSLREYVCFNFEGRAERGPGECRWHIFLECIVQSKDTEKNLSIFLLMATANANRKNLSGFQPHFNYNWVATSGTYRFYTYVKSKTNLFPLFTKTWCWCLAFGFFPTLFCLVAETIFRFAVMENSEYLSESSTHLLRTRVWALH